MTSQTWQNRYAYSEMHGGLACTGRVRYRLGQSSTCVVFIYSSKLPWQGKYKYAGEIFYYSLDDCIQPLSGLLKDYELGKFEAEKKSKLQIECNQDTQTALDTFRTLFCNQAEFANERAAIESLKATTTARLRVSSAK